MAHDVERDRFDDLLDALRELDAVEELVGILEYSAWRDDLEEQIHQLRAFEAQLEAAASTSPDAAEWAPQARRALADVIQRNADLLAAVRKRVVAGNG